MTRTGGVNMRRVPGELSLAGVSAGVCGRMHVMKSGKGVGRKGAGCNGIFEFSVDSEIRAERGSEAAQCSFSQISGAPWAGPTQHQSGSACPRQQWRQKRQRVRAAW